MDYDEIDFQIVILLRQDARLSSKKISKMLNNKISSSAIRRRINTLLEKDAMRIIAFPDWSKLGFPVIAIIALEVPRDKSTSVSKTLGEYDNSLWIAVTSGRYSIMSIWRFNSTEELYKFTENELGKLDGIIGSEIFISLYLAKRT
jgi:Lrp/AsnC family transcriptional regulator for asnA, asnC and gidA